mmetsp:Transcript_27521/g.55516  ORF Transcript_27521/g.55516 Transcript_27521/m.55516 type:complete len:236 (-) Transcript_27521:163-870(-)
MLSLSSSKRGHHGGGRSIFVTVGTTKFDSLISTVSSSQFLSQISKPECGAYVCIAVQYGRGAVTPFVSDNTSTSGVEQISDDQQHDSSDDNARLVEGVSCSSYRFKPTLRQDMEAADLIISHAGAGSIMEGLELCCAANGGRIKGGDATASGDVSQKRRKKLVVVTNAALMNAHQSELADALEARGHLFVVNDPSELLKEETLRQIEKFDQIPFEGGDGGADFAALVDNHFGFEP